MGVSLRNSGFFGMRGITLLLEVMIGLSIFLIAFLFVYGVFPMSQRSLAESRNQMVANNIAREFLEVERDKKIAKVAQGKGKVVVTDTRSGQHEVEGRQSEVNYQVTVVGDDGPKVGTRLVEVAVQWTYGGLQHETKIQSVVGSAFVE
jgi:type II secretory pathway pseudopilin PulG